MRSFTVRSYPVYGTNNFVLSRSRPYLDLWKDNRGNFYQFFYGSDTNSSDYGQLQERLAGIHGKNAAEQRKQAWDDYNRKIKHDDDTYGYQHPDPDGHERDLLQSPTRN